jgi:hypothetical protein
MILESLTIEPRSFEARTGWAIKPEGACRGDVCVPLERAEDGSVDAQTISQRLRMPLVGDDGVWVLGPQFDAAPLESARAPELTLPDWRGGDFSLSSLRGTKVLLIAWASW